MNKLTQLSIKKFRNVAPTTLEFSPGLNVLLGKNAAGKTTLLRLLSTAVAPLYNAFRDDVLEMSYRVLGTSLAYEHTIKRIRVDNPTLPLDSAQPMREEFSGLQQIDSFVLEENGVVVVRAELLPSYEVILDRGSVQERVKRHPSAIPIMALFLALMDANEDPSSNGLPSRLLSARIQGARRMDEGLEGLSELLRFEVKSATGSDGRSNVIGGGPKELPRSMREVLSGQVQEGTSAPFSLDFLNRVAHVLGYDSATARFDIERLSPESGRQTIRLSNLRFFFKRSGEEISHELLSYGQKRLLAFFAHADASQDVVIADELVNGLHHEWISACLDEIADRQAFLTSQNPLLLDFLRFNSVEDVRRTFILCERVSGEAGAQLIWRNLTVDEAESFFMAYETGIQRISDILLTKGLW